MEPLDDVLLAEGVVGGVKSLDDDALPAPETFGALLCVTGRLRHMLLRPSNVVAVPERFITVTPTVAISAPEGCPNASMLRPVA